MCYICLRKSHAIQMYFKMWYEIPNGYTVEVWEWIANFIPHFTRYAIRNQHISYTGRIISIEIWIKQFINLCMAATISWKTLILCQRNIISFYSTSEILLWMGMIANLSIFDPKMKYNRIFHLHLHQRLLTISLYSMLLDHVLYIQIWFQIRFSEMVLQRVVAEIQLTSEIFVNLIYSTP